MSQFDCITNSEDLQVYLDEKFEDLQKRVIQKNNSLDLFLNCLEGRQAKAFEDCGSFLGVDKASRIIQANFCKNRCCPVCNKRYSSKKWYIIKTISEEINKDINPVWLFFTVTVKNVSGKELGNTISHLMESINRMFCTNTWKKRVLGFFRSLEITYNKTEKSFHPHYHILLCMPQDYFKNKDLYLSSYDWRLLWERSARLDYAAQTDIRIINDKDKSELSNAIAEVAKYAVKMSSVAETSQEALKTILKAVRGRRLISYGGIIKERQKDLKNDCTFALEAYESISSGNVTYYTLEGDKFKRFS